MTGLDVERDRVCEVALLRVEGGRVVGELQQLVRPDVKMSKGASRVSGITDELLHGAPRFASVAERVRELLDGAVLIAHNAPFDLTFLHREFDAIGAPLAEPVSLDTLLVARRLFAFPKNSLEAICATLGIVSDGSHRAIWDARATLAIWERFASILDPDGEVRVGELLDLVGALAPNSPLRLQQQKVLREQFAARRSVWIDYASTDAPTAGFQRREVGIWLLKLPYVQGFCHLRQGERVFRLDRMRHVAPGEREVEIPEFEPRI